VHSAAISSTDPTPIALQLGSQSGFNNPNDSISEDTTKKIASLQAKLNQKLGPEYISQRPSPGGGPKLTYVEGWKVINLANKVFGFNGWSSSIISLTIDFADYSEEMRRYCVGVTVLIRVTLRDGVFHEDIGYGMLENAKSKGAALDKVHGLFTRLQPQTNDREGSSHRRFKASAAKI
jgi:DNA repair and recombination protein RAD52